MFSLVIKWERRKNMENKGKNQVMKCFLIGALMLMGGISLASENAIYVINNNAPDYSTGGFGFGGVMCTNYNGICTNGNYIMTSTRTRYSIPQWRKLSIRQRRIMEGKERRIPYAGLQAYYQ